MPFAAVDQQLFSFLLFNSSVIIYSQHTYIFNKSLQYFLTQRKKVLNLWNEFLMDLFECSALVTKILLLIPNFLNITYIWGFVYCTRFEYLLDLSFSIKLGDNKSFCSINIKNKTLCTISIQMELL
jgi:hypothetical protein